MSEHSVSRCWQTLRRVNYLEGAGPAELPRRGSDRGATCKGPCPACWSACRLAVCGGLPAFRSGAHAVEDVWWCPAWVISAPVKKPLPSFLVSHRNKTHCFIKTTAESVSIGGNMRCCLFLMKNVGKTLSNCKTEKKIPCPFITHRSHWTPCYMPC